MRPSVEEWQVRQSIINRLRDKGSEMVTSIDSINPDLAKTSEVMVGVSSELKAHIQESGAQISNIDQTLADMSKHAIESNELENPNNLLTAVAVDQARLMIHASNLSGDNFAAVASDIQSQSLWAFKEPRSMSEFTKGTIPKNMIRDVSNAITQSIETPSLGMSTVMAKVQKTLAVSLAQTAKINTPKAAYELNNDMSYAAERAQSRDPFKNVRGKEIKFEKNEPTNSPPGV